MWLIMIPIFFFHTFFYKILQRCSRKLGLYTQLKDFDENWEYQKDINEELGCYWECITGLDQKRWFARETHHREALGVKLLSDENYQCLKTSKRGKKYI